MQETLETWVRSLHQEDALEKRMAVYSSILAWRITWTEEPGGLQSIGLDTSEATLHTRMHVLLYMIHLKRSCKAYVREESLHLPRRVSQIGSNRKGLHLRSKKD